MSLYFVVILAYMTSVTTNFLCISNFFSCGFVFYLEFSMKLFKESF